MKRLADSLAGAWMAAMLCLATASTVCPARVAGADSALRCGSRLVSIGATPPEVTDKCGEPVYVEQWEEGGEGYVSQLFDYETERYLAPRLIRAPLRMERWTYDFGTNKFVRFLTFQNGRLIRIETGDKP